MMSISSNELPKSKAGQLADLLRLRVRTGEWSGSVPAERSLADEYLVSRTTVRQALGFLEAEGLLEACASTRSGRRVRGVAAGGETRTKAGDVVFLTPSLRDSPLILGQLSLLRELLGPAGVRVSVRENARLGTLRNPMPTVQRLADERPGSVWILHKMSRSVQQAVARAGLPALVFGSSFDGVGLPCIDIDFRAVARHAAGRCLAKGHRRLGVIVHRTPLAGDELIVDAIQAELKRAGGPPLEVMKHDFNRTRLIDALDQRIVGRGDRPDVLLIVNQHHLLTALPHLLRRGVSVPGDLSLLYLNNDAAAERLSPLPARYDTGDALLRRLASAAKARLAGEIPGSSLLLPVAVEGETFG